MRMPAFDGSAKRGTLAKNVLLPHQLIQAPRPHPHGQWCIRSYLGNWGRFTGVE